MALIHSFFYFSLHTNAGSVTGQYWHVTQIDSGISIKFCVSVEFVHVTLCARLLVCVWECWRAW